MANSELGKKAKTSILYNILAKGASTFGQLIGTIFLARLLAPEDFGIVTTGMLVIGFATKFGEFGFHQGLIQKKMRSPNFKSTPSLLLTLPLRVCFGSSSSLPLRIWPCISMNRFWRKHCQYWRFTSCWNAFPRHL